MGPLKLHLPRSCPLECFQGGLRVSHRAVRRGDPRAHPSLRSGDTSDKSFSVTFREKGVHGAYVLDMIATGTDIKPIEIVMFMRSVQSQVLFEQMKGRGVRVIDANELRAVTPDAAAKTHFVIVDCVGVTEHGDLVDTHPLEQRKTVAFRALLEHVAAGAPTPQRWCPRTSWESGKRATVEEDSPRVAPCLLT